VQFDAVEEGEHVGRHLLDRVGRDAGGAADAGEVHEYDLPLGGEGVDESGVPVVKGGAKVNQADQRQAALVGSTEAAVAIGHSVGGFDVQIWSCDLALVGHGVLLNSANVRVDGQAGRWACRVSSRIGAVPANRT
jgi:hypothetical protein